MSNNYESINQDANLKPGCQFHLIDQIRAEKEMLSNTKTDAPNGEEKIVIPYRIDCND